MAEISIPMKHRPPFTPLGRESASIQASARSNPNPQRDPSFPVIPAISVLLSHGRPSVSAIKRASTQGAGSHAKTPATTTYRVTSAATAHRRKRAPPGSALRLNRDNAAPGSLALPSIMFDTSSLESKTRLVPNHSLLERGEMRDRVHGDLHVRLQA